MTTVAEKPSSDEPGSDEPGSDEPASDEPSAERSAADGASDDAAAGAEKSGAAGGPALSSKRARLFKVVTALVVFLVCFGVGEIGARVLGRKPWSSARADGKLDRFQIEPGGTLYAPHASLGFGLLPGSFTVKQSRGVVWHVRHEAPIHRATRPADAPAPEGRPAVWIFGDSYTYGWAVDDEQTYAWLLQQRHPELDVVNFGVGGFSNLQSLIELEEAVAAIDAGKTKAPRVVTLGYASFHDGRNAMLRGNRKSWIPYVAVYPSFPRGWIEDGKLRYALEKLEYTPWPLQQTSALVNVIEEAYDKSQVITSGSRNVSKAIIQSFAQHCKQRGIAFVLAGINLDGRTEAMVKWAADQGILAVEIGVDQSIPENAVPGDGHPSAKAHVHFADGLEPQVTAAVSRR